jgi:hypothetical protein
LPAIVLVIGASLARVGGGWAARHQAAKAKEVAMNKRASYRSIDLVVVAVANLMNIIMVVVFLLRSMMIERLQVVGFIWAAFILVLAAVVALNIRTKREWWAIVLPLLLVVFLIVEVALDYIAKYDFRSTILLGPYLLLYYVSILGMIGYSFLTEKKYGFITLTTYFLSQIAAFYSYFKVSHGWSTDLAWLSLQIWVSKA